MPVVLARVACAALLSGLLAGMSAGCSRGVVRPDELRGRDVASMAERELEAENPELVTGTLKCPDLAFRVGASVRCMRTTTLTNGRVVKVAGTVRVTSLASGGRLHVAMDEHAAEFGVSGGQVAAELRRRLRQLFRREDGTVTCPYLPARVGATVRCHLRIGKIRRTVDAVVTGVDAEKYGVRYDFQPHGTPTAKPS
jgi:hypothetical protein